MRQEKLQSPLLTGKGLPNFEQITSIEIENQIPCLIDNLEKDFNMLEQKLLVKLQHRELMSWDETIKPLFKLEERLRWSWGIVTHLNGVSNSPELRKSYISQEPLIVRFTNRIGQSKVLFEVISKLLKNSTNSLNRTQKRILEAELLSMKNKGVGLQGKEQIKYNKNSERLASLSTTFNNNVLDATKEWKLLLTKPEEVDGLPKRSLETMAKSAHQQINALNNPKEAYSYIKGPWLLTLDMPCYIPFITYAKNESLRETIYKAYVSRASTGNTNNGEIIEEILLLRKEQAKLLGYKDWVELSLAGKMAKDIDQVEQLLEEIRTAAIASANKEIKHLELFAAKKCNLAKVKLNPWDVSFWSEQLRQEHLGLDQEALRPWFPLPQVLDGLFNLCERLFEISIKPREGDYSVWHSDVKLFDVQDKNRSNIASFFLDPYSRPGSKQGGAWMNECLIKEKLDNGDEVVPVAYLICNQTPPSGNVPSLMSFDEVKTLFHEFGHGLQHMLTTVEEPKAAGINNVEWDAVELPSQFMENWCLDNKTIKKIAKHWETGEPLLDIEITKLKNNETFNSGLANLRQIHFALTDLRLHSEWSKEAGVTPDEIRREVAKSTSIIEPIPEDKFLCAFSHIFAGGYSAGYYSYKWSEVLSADAFSAFEEVGLENEEEVKLIGKLFKNTILSLGGSLPPSEIFKSFRGRPASTEALIRHSGLNQPSISQ